MEGGGSDPSAMGAGDGSSRGAGDGQRQGEGPSAQSAEPAATPSPASAGTSSASTPGSRSSVTRKRYRNADLKSFFTSNSSSGSAPSTHQCENAAVSSEEVQEVAVPVEVEPPGNAEADAEPRVAEPDAELIQVFDSAAHVISDPGLRIPIERFHPNIRGDVQRAYLLKGPTKPFGHNFPRKSSDNRAFLEPWLKTYDWIEYSVAKDAAFCFYCYLFKQEPIDDKFGHDAFTKAGYINWKNAYHGLPLHIGGPLSCHNRARAASTDFMNQKASVRHKVETHEKDAQVRYETRVTAALDVGIFLIAQGHSFRGHDETIASLNRGNFLEMIEWYKKRDEEVRAAFEDLCPLNAQMISHKIQKDICESYATEISDVIKREIGDKCFSVLIDESRDVSIAEQMAVIVRFVNDKGMVVERFLGLKHVADTTSNALKKALVQMLAKYGLPIARLRGQGYDGASNMRGQFNGLQKKIRDENPYAFYVHCFAHQLQLVIVSVTTCCSSFNDFFTYVSMIATSVGSSCQRKDKLIAKHRDKILERLESDPRDSFSKFDVDKIARLTEIYDQDFSSVDRSLIKDQLETFLMHVRRVDAFIGCKDLGSLAKTMVETKMHIPFSLVYRLIELALLLPVATASVERAFSAMNIIKTDLRNRMSDEWLNDLILCYIEKEIFVGLDFEKVKKRFQAMKDRRMEFPKPPRGPTHA
ncbi:unnamed protein product [Urochloa humidicola]